MILEGQCQKVLEKTYTWKQTSKVILENITATRSWKRLICFHRWEQKSQVTLEKVTAKEPWKRHGRNAMGCTCRSWKRPKSLGKGQEALEKAKEALENVLGLWKRPK